MQSAPDEWDMILQWGLSGGLLLACAAGVPRLLRDIKDTWGETKITWNKLKESEQVVSIHVMSARCSTCIFRPGNLMSLDEGRVEGMIEEADGQNGFIPCHQTFDWGPDDSEDDEGNPLPYSVLNGPQAICRGYFDRRSSMFVRLALALKSVTVRVRSTQPRRYSMTRTRKLFLAVTLGLGLMFLLTAGSCDEKGLGDAPVGNAYEAPRDVIVMPDLFANLMVACDGPNRVYITTREAPPVVLQNDANCPEDGPALTEQGDEVDPETLSGDE